ncbi:MAG TPA: chromosomal replication initiator protein DnaA [Candidatus Acidoferrum sp.]|nr:chromosomal replication initiator protein DnaA [Candidatus Acidoferrum sp.]
MQNSLWQTVLGEIELTVSRASFMTWFKNTELVEQQGGQVVIAVPNIFTKQQLEVKFTQQIKDTLERNKVSVNHIEFIIQSSTKKRAAEAIHPAVVATEIVASAPTATKTKGNSLNPKYVFETFIVGSSNDLAYAACQAIVGSPGTKYNPLFLYGGVGLGKTHLMQAVGNEIVRQNPQADVLYTSTQAFVDEFLECMKSRSKQWDSSRYRNVDVLIIDDMQFIAGKQATQEEFFHTFNSLHQANKQIIISSDKPPKSIPTLEDRLRSRFEWGMAIDLQAPDFETRCAILQTKAGQSGFTLDRDTVEYLATNIQTNIRELEGALNQLLAFCEMRGTRPDLQTASGLLGNVRASRPHHLTVRQVIDKTAKHFQVEPVDIVSPKRDKHIVVPRQIAMYLLRSELHMSFPKIASELGRKDHTTAIHSVEKIEKAIKLDFIIRQQVTDIREKLYV